jgi:hypothetical protein
LFIATISFDNTKGTSIFKEGGVVYEISETRTDAAIDAGRGTTGLSSPTEIYLADQGGQGVKAALESRNFKKDLAVQDLKKSSNNTTSPEPSKPLPSPKETPSSASNLLSPSEIESLKKAALSFRKQILAANPEAKFLHP